MVSYVIKKTETGEFVARFGAEHSYTKRLQDAQTFSTQEQAEPHRCGNEVVLRLEDVMSGTMGSR